MSMDNAPDAPQSVRFITILANKSTDAKTAMKSRVCRVVYYCTDHSYSTLFICLYELASVNRRLRLIHMAEPQWSYARKLHVLVCSSSPY